MAFDDLVNKAKEALTDERIDQAAAAIKEKTPDNVDSIVDLSSYAGEIVKLRFNVGHDRFAHRADPNWAIDDVRVAGCSAAR